MDLVLDVHIYGFYKYTYLAKIHRSTSLDLLHICAGVIIHFMLKACLDRLCDALFIHSTLIYCNNVLCRYQFGPLTAFTLGGHGERANALINSMVRVHYNIQ